MKWNKYQSKVTEQARNRYFNYSIDPSRVNRVNRLFVLSFENRLDREVPSTFFQMQKQKITML